MDEPFNYKHNLTRPLTLYYFITPKLEYDFSFPLTPYINYFPKVKKKTRLLIILFTSLAQNTTNPLDETTYM